MYKFEVAFNDGTVGEANAKSQQPPYKVGEMAYYVKLKITKNPPPPGGFKQFQPAKQDPDKDKKMIRGMCFKVAGMAWANQYKHKSFELPHEVMVKDVISLAKKYEQAYNEWMEE